MICTNTQTRCFENYGLSLQGQGFSKAMTAKEARAFVGDITLPVNTLQDDKLFLDPPRALPQLSHRQRQDNRHVNLTVMLL